MTLFTKLIVGEKIRQKIPSSVGNSLRLKAKYFKVCLVKFRLTQAYRIEFQSPPLYSSFFELLKTTMYILSMAVRVVEFSNGGYKIRKVFA
jgi:hypothetical protein